MKKIIGLTFFTLLCFSCQENDLFTEENSLTEPTTRAMSAGYSKDTLFNVADFEIHGKTRMAAEKVFTRVPAIYYSDGDLASGNLRRRRLPEHTTGLYVTFETNSPNVTIKFKTIYNSGYYSTSADPGLESGVELYEQLNGGMVSRVIAIPPKGQQSGTLSYNAPDKSYRTYLVFLPAYNGIDEMILHTKSGSGLRQKELFQESQKLPILYYGTSLTQGSCASIYSKSYTALTLLELGHEVINLGFDGVGQANKQMVDFVIQQPSAAFVVDVVWNMKYFSSNLQAVRDRVLDLIVRYRQNNPTTPILLMSKFNRASNPPGSAWEEALFKKMYIDLRAAGINDVYFQPRGNVSYQQWKGGTHPNNVGMRTLADIINRRLKGMLAGEATRKVNFKKYNEASFHTTGSDNNLYIDGYSGLDTLDLKKFFPASAIGDYTKITSSDPMNGKKYIAVEQFFEKSNIKVRYADRDHLGYSTKVIVTDDGTCEDVEFNIVASPVILPTETVAGREWMIFNNSARTKETAMQDNMEIAAIAPNTQAIVNILRSKNINQYEKLIGHFYNYNKTTAATRLKGKPLSSPSGNPCPPGFELPSLQDYRNLMGMPTLDIINNTIKVGHISIPVGTPWTSPNKSVLTLKDDGAFAGGALMDQVSPGVRYTTVAKDGVTLYFINNGSFDDAKKTLYYMDKCTAVLTKDLALNRSKRICFGRNGWPIEANSISYAGTVYTGARCVKSSVYETKPLQ